MIVFKPRHLSLTLLVLFLIPFSACKDKPDVPASPDIISLVGVNVFLGTCIMKDAGGNAADTFKVAAGKKIQWSVQTIAMKDITNVYKKSASQDVFSDPPHRVGVSSTWEGTISASATGKEEDYNIDWTDQAGTTYVFDPKIQVK